MDQNIVFEQQRPRLLRVAERILGDSHEAEDVVQNAWLRMEAATTEIYNLPGWLTTAITRLCLDRLRARIPLAEPDVGVGAVTPDPAEDLALAETVGVALRAAQCPTYDRAGKHRLARGGRVPDGCSKWRLHPAAGASRTRGRYRRRPRGHQTCDTCAARRR